MKVSILNWRSDAIVLRDSGLGIVFVDNTEWYNKVKRMEIK